MSNFKKELADFINTEAEKLKAWVHEQLYPRKLGTLWYRWNKNGWEFNHLEDGHCPNDIPTPVHPGHVALWSGGKWAKAYIQLNVNEETGVDKVQHYLIF